MVLVIKLGDRFLKEIDGFQALEWTHDIKESLQFNGQGVPYAHQVAETYGAQILRYNPTTGSVSPY